MRPVGKRILAVLSLAVMLPLTLMMAIPASAAVNMSYFRNPVNAVYTPYETGGNGLARGELTVRVSGWISTSACPMEALVYWANADGPLDGYTALARFKLTSRTTTFEFPSMQIIPEGADRLRVYTAAKGTDTVSTVYVDAALPANSDYDMSERPEYVFGVVSDTHVLTDETAKTLDYNTKFANMLTDISSIISSSNAKNSQTGIFINGDLIDAVSQGGPATELEASTEQYANLWDMQEQKCPNIPIYMAVGNHDLWPRDSLVAASNLFLQNAKLPDGSHPTSMTYDFWIGDCHFVFLGDDDDDTNYATINEEHLNWLDNTISKGYDKGKTFLFLHQTLSNTVAGAITEYPEQEHNGVVNEAELRKVLRKYPNAIMFSGHTHWTLNSVRAAFDGGDGNMPNIFATSSVANPVDNFGVKLGNGNSEGLVVEVYEDKVILRGRDFKNQLWMASAMYVVDLAEPEDITPPSADDKNNSEDTTSKPSGNKKPSSNNNSNDTVDTDDTDDTAQNDIVDDSITDVEDSKREENGCESALGAAPIALCAVPAALALKKKKKKE